MITAKISSAGNITSETTLQKGWSTPSGVGWSPDSKWLAFSMSDLSFNSEVYIQAADGKTDAINVSMHPRGDYSPVWSPDGSKLGFTSSRNNSDSDIWYVWLKKEDYQKTKQDWDDEESETSDDKEDSEESIDIIIDRELIHERLAQLTSLSGDEGGLAISKDGKTFYFTSTSPVNKGSDLYKINWDKTDMEAVTKGGRSPRGIELDSEGKYLYLSMKGKLSRIAVSSDKLESLPFKGKMTVDFEDELNQVFEEGWRALRDGFYDPEFHGQNWEQLRTKYKPYCMSASTKTDFLYMYNNMLGQLNASHMGLRGSDREDTQNERTGL